MSMITQIAPFFNENFISAQEYMGGKKWIFGHFTRFTRAILKSTLTRGRLEL